HCSARGTNDQPVRFRDRMRHADEFDVERPDGESAVECDDIDRNVRCARLAPALGLEQRGREWGGVDRHLQLRPQIEEGAEMIFVRVGQDDAEEIAAFLDEIANIGEYEVYPGKIISRKCHPEIDRDPLPRVLLTEPVESEVHPDLARSTEWREDK